MIYLNFTDLSQKRQQELLFSVKPRLREELKEEAITLDIDLEVLVDERAEQKLATYDFIFNF